MTFRRAAILSGAGETVSCALASIMVCCNEAVSYSDRGSDDDNVPQFSAPYIPHSSHVHTAGIRGTPPSGDSVGSRSTPPSAPQQPSKLVLASADSEIAVRISAADDQLEADAQQDFPVHEVADAPQKSSLVAAERLNVLDARLVATAVKLLPRPAVISASQRATESQRATQQQGKAAHTKRSEAAQK